MKTEVSWQLFEIYNPNSQDAFEDMCRRIFKAKYLQGKVDVHVDHNLPGIEILPVLEPEREDGRPRKRISFQAKYTKNPSSAYQKFKESARQTVEHFQGKLDCVYLFCNQTLTTISKQYEAIEKIHSEAGIETRPVSNKELIDMIVEYSNITNCFFTDQTHQYQTSTQNKQSITIGSITENYIIPQGSEIYIKNYDNKLLIKLVSEKLKLCKKYAQELEIEALRTEVENLISVGKDNIDSRDLGEICYYELLLDLQDGKNTDNSLKGCAENHIDEAKWLIQFYKSPFRLSVEEWNKHTPIVQIFAIDKLFTSEHWNDIENLHCSLGSNIYSDIRKQFVLHYGLSLLNLQKNKEASCVLHDLYEETHEQRMEFYATIANIRDECDKYVNAEAGNSDALKKLLKDLDSYKDLPQYKKQELLVAGVKIQAYYCLGVDDGSYHNIAILEYNTYEEHVKKHPTIKYYLGLCYEHKREYEHASRIYAELDWKTNNSLATRYMMVLRLDNKSKKVVDIYNGLEQSVRSVENEAIYLSALKEVNFDLYTKEIKKACSQYGDNLPALIQIAYCEDDLQSIYDRIWPTIKKNLRKKSSIDGLSFPYIIKLIIVLAIIQEVVALKNIICSISDITKINLLTVKIIYQSLYNVCYGKSYITEKNSNNEEKQRAAAFIADKFITANVYKKYFLELQLQNPNVKEKPYSMLEYSKELYKETFNIEIARNIVVLLVTKNETNPHEYEPFIPALKQSNNPDYCMVVASAYLLMGKEEEADSFAYKALYLLNGKDDYDIYKLYFGYGNHKMHLLVDDNHTSNKNIVVTVSRDENGIKENRTICLDSEMDFTYENNRSLGLEHLNPRDVNYFKIQNAQKGKTINIDGKSYTVEDITSRNQQCMRFIFQKIYENPDEFQSKLIEVKIDNPQETIEQFRKIFDNSSQIESLMDNYHFENNSPGLPIECIINCNYDRYISVMRYLIYSPDEALYTGNCIYETIDNKVYVPTLSTLVLLSLTDMMYCLDGVIDKCIIPDSYISFFTDRFEKALIEQKNDVKQMYFDSNGMSISDTDITISEIWEKIICFCKKCKHMPVSDKERMELQLYKEMTTEELAVGLKLHQIQLDGLVLAKRESAAYICDDLFMRKIAQVLNIHNYNIASIIMHYTDIEFKTSTIMKLSETNYIYLPLIAKSYQERQELCQHLLTGKRKKAIYEPYIKQLNEELEKMIKQIVNNIKSNDDEQDDD